MHEKLMGNFKDKAVIFDREDPLRAMRNEFYLPEGAIYLDGNSLGLASKRSEMTLMNALDDWKKFGIDGWTKGENPWYHLAETLGEKSAPFLGAKTGEVIITGSTSANLHQILSTFFKPAGMRRKILIEEAAFPTDAHVVKGQLALKGLDSENDLVVVPSQDGTRISEEDVIARMSEEIAVMVLPVVLYRSGQLLDIARLTAEAHKRGILVCFDACHSAGILPHNFHEDGVDFGVFCTYKHMNGGPGSVGGLYVHEKHFGSFPGLPGWFGSKKEKQFDMENVLDPSVMSGAFQVGTPHVLSMAPILGALQILTEVGIAEIRKKSLKLTDFLMDMIDEELAGFGFSVATRRAHEARGGHVALRHADAARICKTLKEKGVTPDFRSPDIVRLAPAPLYTSFTELYEVVQVIKHIMKEKLYEKHSNVRDLIA